MLQCDSKKLHSDGWKIMESSEIGSRLCFRNAQQRLYYISWWQATEVIIWILAHDVWNLCTGMTLWMCVFVCEWVNESETAVYE